MLVNALEALGEILERHDVSTMLVVDAGLAGVVELMLLTLSRLLLPLIPWWPGAVG